MLNYTRRVLPKKNSGVYSRNSDLALFHLSARLNICWHPGCPGNVLSRQGLTDHLDDHRDCLGFYQREGSRLLQWEEELNFKGVGVKVKDCRKNLKRDLQIEEEEGPKSFNQQQVNILDKFCNICLMQGPLLGKKSYDMDPTSHYEACQEITKNIADTKEDLRSMGEAQGGEEPHGVNMRKIDDTMTPIFIQSDDQESRVVFVPSVLAADRTRAPEDQVFVSPTVLVPIHEDAIDEIGPGAFNRAYDNKGKLKLLTELFFKQGIRTDITRGMSVAWRKLLSDVQQTRLNVYHAMGKGKGKGEVLERNPNKKAKITEGKQLWFLSNRDCLKKTLQWSHANVSQREEESKSTMCVNGQVKTYIKFCVLDSFDNTNGILPAIIARAAGKNVQMKHLDIEEDALPKFSYEVLCGSFCNPDTCENTENHTSTEQFVQEYEQYAHSHTAPIVLNYLWGRLQLLEKHFFSREYSDYDIDINWNLGKWTVEGEGYLYSEEYDEINRCVARGGVSLEERAELALKHSMILPTVLLDANAISDIYKLSEPRAQDVVELAQKHQNTSNSAEPPSLLTMWTGKGVQASEEEENLRKSLVKWAEERLPENTSFEHSTLLVTRKWSDQLKSISIVEEKLRELHGKIEELCEASSWGISDEDRHDLALYHLLLWKTTGNGEWTYMRGRKEIRVVPYLPKALELTRMKMETTTILGGGLPIWRQSEVPLDPLLANLVDNAESWKEVSVLEFMNSVSPQRVKEIKSQTHVDVKAGNSKKLSWRPQKSTDANEGEDIFKSFDKKLKTDKEFVGNNTPRKLYTKRPAAVRAMKYGQFACQYRQLYPSQKGYKDSYEECNNSNNTKVGPDSDFDLIGVQGIAAPTSMLLGNGTVMKLRDNSIAVPLLPSDEMNYVTDELLFGEWQAAEDITEEAEVSDTPLRREKRRTARLELFPKMVFD